MLAALIEKTALPVYPEAAHEKQLEGDVVLQILIDETGRIAQTKALSGEALLVAASMDALREFRYRPYLLNGTAVSVESVVGFHFSKTGKVESLPNPYSNFRTGAVRADGTYVLSPHKLTGDDPKLPPELAGKSGSVYLTAMVGADGLVKDVQVIGGDQQFVAFVVAAVREYKYEPQLVDGEPTPSNIEMSFHFGNAR